MFEKDSPQRINEHDTTNANVNCGIHCDVKNCVYHSSDHYCTLDKVSIGAVDSIDCATSSDTLCSSFKAKD